MPERINVLLIGGGGREHAMARALRRSARLGELWTTHPDNPGLAALARGVDVPVSIREIYRLQQFCEKQRIGLVVIGPEEPLAQGFADKLATPDRLVFGPTAEAAQIESDKAWAKRLMRSASIPTGEARTFTDPESAAFFIETRVQDDDAIEGLMREAGSYTDPAERRRFIDEKRRTDRRVASAYAASRADLPVIKASGLAKGKGVVVPATLGEALTAIHEIMVRRVFGEAGRTVVIEERLQGPEVSVLALVDGRSIYVLDPAQDHKRLGDQDTGPNTGGMGAFCPSALLDDTLLAQVEREILVPAVDAMRREGIEYRGVLYAGIMLTPAGPKVLEFNCRFGDPECQAILARLESDFLELLLATAERRLDSCEVRWTPGASCCVVMAAEGYPGTPKAGVVIEGLDAAEATSGVHVLHAGTRRDEAGRIVSAGGRVLNVVGVGADLAEARERAYAACAKIKFPGGQVRKDIGRTPEPGRARTRPG